MGYSSLTLMRWRTRIVGAYSLAFAAVAALVGWLPLGPGGLSSTIASGFLSSLKASCLPAGWLVIFPGSARFEVDAIASVLLAFLVCYPIAAYGVIRLVSPSDLGRKTIAALVVGASVVFYGGAVWGLAAGRYYIIASLPIYFGAVGMSPVLSGYDFYTILMRAILGWALVFIAPIFLTFFFELRRARASQWHL